MGFMNRLRENTGVVLWLLVFAFGVIWVLQDSGGLDVIGNTAGNNIAEVNGDAIELDAYNRALENQVQAYQQQTGQSMSPQRLDAERDRVFDALVEDLLREQAIERLGIRVTDEEVYNMVMGPTPHPIIKVYFGDGEGGVDRALLQNFAENPEARQDWIQIEEFLRAERRREKLNALLAAAVRVTDLDVKDEYLKRAKQVDARYVALRYADLSDDSIRVTDADLKRFYDKNREEFKQKRTYSVTYVTRSKAPTPADSALIRDELAQIKTRFAAAENDSLFLLQNGSETQFNGSYFNRSSLGDEIAAALGEAPQPGQVIGPLVQGDQATLIKVLDTRQAESPAVKARHILLRAEEGDEAARATARALADSLKGAIQRGASFADIARNFSDDGSSIRGGDLGWFSRGMMVAPFEEAAFAAPVGQLVGPVETQFGYHLIEVTDRSSREYKLAVYTQGIRSSVETINEISEQLDDLQYYASESGDFAGEAQRLGLTTQQMQIEADQRIIPGLGQSRAIANFLEGAEAGAVSDVIELDDQFVVMRVDEIAPEGYRPLADVRGEIEPRVRLEKKKEIQVRRMQQAYQRTGYDGLAQALGTTEQTAEGLTFTNPLVPGFGREFKFTGAALGLKEGQNSGVIVGDNAVYVIKTTSVRAPEMTAAQRDEIRQELRTQRISLLQNQWLASLREQAKIEDHRRRFQQ